MTRPKSSKRSEVRTLAEVQTEVQSQLHHEQSLKFLFNSSRYPFWEGWRDRFASADKRRQNGQATPVDYLVLFRFLPDRVLECMGFEYCLQSKAQIGMYEQAMERYQALSEWLLYLEGSIPVSEAESLFHSDKVNFKPRAQFSKTVLVLIIELFPKCPELQEKFNTPLEIWYSWELSVLKEYIEVSGLVSGMPGKRILQSKKKIYEGFRQMADWLESPQRDDGKQVEKSCSLPLALMVFARNIAKSDPAFRRSQAYRNYWKGLSQFGQGRRKSGLSTLYIDDGQLKITGRSSPRPSKNFVTKSLPKTN